MRAAYSLLLYLLTPLVLARLAWRGLRAPAYWQRWGERFGFYHGPDCTGCIWLHAVSLGETLAAAPLVRALHERYPDTPLLMTTTTPTGSAQVMRLFGDSVCHVYVPYDLPDAVARFMTFAKPQLALIMETELWPNLYRACAVRGVPLIVANARLSPRSFAGYQRLAPLVRSTLGDVSVIAAQSAADAERFRVLRGEEKMGSDPIFVDDAPDQSAGEQKWGLTPFSPITVTGSIKFDLQLPEQITEEGVTLRRMLGAERPVWIAASTHEGEDKQVLDAHAQLRAQYPDALLILVPRHPERFTRVAELCARRGERVVRRSAQSPCTAETTVFLGDSMGELLLFYAAADVAFVGGSLVETGGHNPLEPAALGVPVLFGPHTFNFADISQLLLAREAARAVTDSATLAAAATALFADPAVRAALGAHGRAVVEENRGALARLLDIVTVAMGAQA